MRGSWILLLAVLLVAPTSLAQETSTNSCTLSQVLRARADIRESAAAFTQERRIRFVREPVLSTGRLRFVAPDHLEMVIETPRPESFVYQDGVLTFDAADQEAERQISVESDAMLSAMFTALVGTLSGNETELRRAFFVDFHADDCQWRMTLVSKSKRALEKIREINLKGKDHHIEETEILQSNGDRSILTISELE